MKRNVLPPLTDITSEQKILEPEKDGLEGIPAVSFARYRTNWRALPKHVHEGCIELCFCARGSLVFECEGKTHTLLPDNVFLTQPGDRHHLVTNHKGMRMYWLFFRYPAKGRAVLGLTAVESAALVRKLRAIQPHTFAVNGEMKLLFRDFFRAYADLPKGAFRALTLRTAILRILLLTVKCSGNPPTLKTLAKISRIAEVMSKRPSHRFTVAELAVHAKLSQSRFTSLFRQVVGLPPYAYLASCRLNKAKRCLSETDVPIRDIAEELGYASPQHFAMQFRKTFGTTATDWRTQHRSQPQA